MSMLGSYIKRKWKLLALLGACTGLFAWVLSLYQLPTEPAGYAGALCLILVLLAGIVDFLVWRRKVLLLESIEGQAALLL